MYKEDPSTCTVRSMFGQSVTELPSHGSVTWTNGQGDSTDNLLWGVRYPLVHNAYTSVWCHSCQSVLLVGITLVTAASIGIYLQDLKKPSKPRSSLNHLLLLQPAESPKDVSIKGRNLDSAK